METDCRIVQLEKEKFKLLKFIDSSTMVDRRKPTLITVEFYNSRFGTKSGMSNVDGSSFDISYLNQALIDAAKKRVEEINIQINEINIHNDNTRGNSNS